MMAVSVSTQPKFTASAPRLLFQGRYARRFEEDGPRNYDVSPDGRGFVMIRESAPPPDVTQLNVVLGWFEELRKQVAGNR